MEEFYFYLSKKNRLILPEFDLDLLVDINNSQMPSMPEATESFATISGRDGDVVLSTTYEAITFSLQCYTEDNLTQEQKDEYQRKLNIALNKIKNTTNKFGIEKEDKYYNVKYAGYLTVENYPKCLKFIIPLKTSNPFAYSMEEKVIIGNGTEESETVEKVGALITIQGPATNPIISLNDYAIEYDMSIVENARVEIDTNKFTITNITNDGIKTNVMKYFNHQFPKIEQGTNELKILSGIDDETQVTVKWNDFKL